MKTIEYLKNILTGWKASATSFLPNVFLALVVLFLFFIIGKIAKKVVLKSYSKVTHTHFRFAQLISACVYFLCLISGAFLALEILGLEKLLTKVLASAGIVGIIAGFAFKDIASNAFAGMLLNINRPFKIGDWVQINDNYGVVSGISWITTALKTVPGQEVFVPNQLIYSSTFTNFSSYGTRRVILQSGVSYKDDLEHVKEVALDEVMKIESLLKDRPADFYYTEIWNSTLNFKLRFYINFQTDEDFDRAMSNIIVRIKKRFDAESISIIYPVTINK